MRATTETGRSVGGSSPSPLAPRILCARGSGDRGLDDVTLYGLVFPPDVDNQFARYAPVYVDGQSFVL